MTMMFNSVTLGKFFAKCIFEWQSQFSKLSKILKTTSIYLERYRSIYIRSEAQQQFINFRILQVSSFGSNHRPSDLNARRKTSAYHW